MRQDEKAAGEREGLGVLCCWLPAVIELIRGGHDEVGWCGRWTMDNERGAEVDEMWTECEAE